MIHFICGRPGGGKSLYTTHLIVRELSSGARRCVVTNMPLNIGPIRDYFEVNYPSVEYPLSDYIRLLDDDTETACFYLHRPWGYRVRPVTKEDERSGLRLNFGQCERVDKSFDLRWWQRIAGSGAPSRVTLVSDAALDPKFWAEIPEPETVPCSALPSCFYVVDEAQNFYGSRDWADVGKSLLFYLSQHRKLGDTVLCVTQNEKNVDRQFRSVAQDYSYVRNYGKEKLGVFRKPKIFLRSTYLEPKGSGIGQQPLEIKTVSLDIEGIAKLYDTARGVGVAGVGADSGEHAKGLSPYWVLAGFIALMVFVWFSGDIVARSFDVVTGVKRSVPAKSTNSAPFMVSNSVPLPSSVPVRDLMFTPDSQLLPFSTNVFVVGFMRYRDSLGVQLTWYLSDGQSFNSRQSGVLGRDGSQVRVFNTVYRAATRSELSALLTPREVVKRGNE